MARLLVRRRRHETARVLRAVAQQIVRGLALRVLQNRVRVRAVKHAAGALDPQVRNSRLRAHDRGMGGMETGGVVVGTEQSGQVLAAASMPPQRSASLNSCRSSWMHRLAACSPMISAE